MLHSNRAERPGLESVNPLVFFGRKRGAPRAAETVSRSMRKALPECAIL